MTDVLISVGETFAFSTRGTLWPFPVLDVFHRLKQLPNPQTQSISQFFDVDQADISCTAFDVAEIGSVDAGAVGELFLSQSPLFAAQFDREAELFADVTFSRFGHCGQNDVV